MNECIESGKMYSESLESRAQTMATKAATPANRATNGLLESAAPVKAGGAGVVAEGVTGVDAGGATGVEAGGAGGAGGDGTTELLGGMGVDAG